MIECRRIAIEETHGTSLRASSPIWASEASLENARASGEAATGRGRERAALLSSVPSLARSREAHFAYPNRRACSQASMVHSFSPPLIQEQKYLSSLFCLRGGEGAAEHRLQEG